MDQIVTRHGGQCVRRRHAVQMKPAKWSSKLQISVVAQIINRVKTGQVMVGKGDAVTNLEKAWDCDRVSSHWQNRRLLAMTAGDILMKFSTEMPLTVIGTATSEGAQYGPLPLPSFGMWATMSLLQ